MERQVTGFEFTRLPDPFSRDDMPLLEREVARLQAEVTRQVAAGFWRGVRKAAAAVADGFALVLRAAAAARLYNELSRLGDATLASMGLDRQDIPRVAAASMEDGADGPPLATAPAAVLRTVGGAASSATAADNDQDERRAA